MAGLVSSELFAFDLSMSEGNVDRESKRERRQVSYTNSFAS